MWIIYAVLVGIFLTVAASAFVQGQYGFAVAFIIIAVLYAMLGAREIRGGKDR
jgi:hypothetical protein